MVFFAIWPAYCQTGKRIPLAKAQSREEQQKPRISRREGDTKDIYARAKKLLRLKLIEIPTHNREDG